MTLAKTDLENVYCQIAATPDGRTLPAFSDFRRNNAQVQALLLKRPAERLGIKMPSSSGQQKRTANRTQRQTQVEPKTRPAASSRPATVVVPESPISPPAPPVVSKPGLSRCRFLGDNIACGDSVFRLASNRQNNQLKPGALGPTNLLILSSFNGQLNNKVAVNNYLADSYQLYIEKMLLIGLGASTMTYTKFHYTFWELVEKRENFANRVGDMYDFIKKDKASMAIKARYGNDLPGGMDWCTELSDKIIVCDNGKKNWVYVRGS